jgi:hypothetical protein
LRFEACHACSFCSCLLLDFWDLFSSEWQAAAMMPAPMGFPPCEYILKLTVEIFDEILNPRTLKMKCSRALISLMLCAQLAGFAHAQDSGCKPPENRSDCESARSAARKRIAPGNMERPPAPVGQAPAPPTVTGSCDAGGCWDNGANRYHGGTGNTYLDSRGKPCHRVGSWMQCF